MSEGNDNKARPQRLSASDGGREKKEALEMALGQIERPFVNRPSRLQFPTLAPAPRPNQ